MNERATNRIRFTHDLVDAFRKISHDRNPLHSDPDYARRTPFGDIVVHGAASLLLALGHYLKGCDVRLLELSADFRRPLSVGVEYDLRIDTTLQPASLEIWRGDELQTQIRVATAPAERARWPQGTRRSAVLAEARSPERGSVSAVRVEDYASSPSAEALALFGLHVGQFPIDQLDALCWSSYFVGMEYPGRHALFSQMLIRSEDSPADPEAGFVAAVECTFDPRLALVRITGRCSGVREINLRAFWRPAPVDLSVAEIAQRVGRSRRFAGRQALVLGSSRGFGRVAALGLALEGAKVVLHGRTSSPELENTLDAMLSSGGVGRSVVAELGPGGASGLRSALDGPLDILILSASPPISTAGYRERSVAESLRFVERSMTMVAEPLWELLPTTVPGSTVVAISTTYLTEPPRRLSHYLAAKGAIEGLIRAVAVEWPDRRFVIFRAPRMLTDQTNIPVDFEPKTSPLDVTTALLDALSAEGIRGRAEVVGSADPTSNPAR